MILKLIACLLCFCLTNTILFAVPENGNIRMNPTGVKSFKLVKKAKVEWFSTSEELRDENNHTWKVDSGTLNIFPATANQATFDPSAGFFDIDFQKAGHYEIKISITYKYGTLSQTLSKTFVLDLVEVKITTTATQSSTLKIIHEEPGEINISASVIPSDRNIIWTITNYLIAPEFVEGSSTQTGGNSVYKIQLKRPVNDLWRIDTFIIVTAKDSVLEEDCTDLTIVDLIQFKRKGEIARGSNPIKIALPPDSTPIGYTFANGNEDGSIRANTSDMIEKIVAGPKTPSTVNSGDLKYYYQSELDIGKGSFKVSAEIIFEGLIFCTGTYKGSRHNASVSIGGGCSASVGNDNVLLTDSIGGAYFGGYPTTTTLGITAGGGTAGGSASGSAGGSLSVTFVSSAQDSLLVYKEPKGTYQISEKEVHPAGMSVEITKKIKVASGSILEQKDDNEWDLESTIFFKGLVPKSPYIEFFPEF